MPTPQIDTQAKTFTHRGREYSYELKVEQIRHHSTIYTAIIRDESGQAVAARPGFYYHMGTASEDMYRSMTEIVDDPSLQVNAEQAMALGLAGRPQVGAIDDGPSKSHLRLIEGGLTQDSPTQSL